MEEEGVDEGMLRQYLTKIAKSCTRRGSEIGQSFIVLMLGCEMRPQHLLLYHKRIII
jgi:hypothetical protein